jgi:hypothetical protein
MASALMSSPPLWAPATLSSQSCLDPLDTDVGSDGAAELGALLSLPQDLDLSGAGIGDD